VARAGAHQQHLQQQQQQQQPNLSSDESYKSNDSILPSVRPTLFQRFELL